MKQIITLSTFALLLAGCAAPSPQNPVIGSWVLEGNEDMAGTFFVDGTCVLKHGEKTVNATYTLSETQMTIMYDDRVDVGDYEIRDGKFILTAEGQTAVFIRQDK